MATHSSTLAWKIPWTEEPGGLQSMGSLGVDTTEWLHFHFSLSWIGEGNGNPLQCSCLENPRTGEPDGLPSMGSHRVGHDWRDLAAAAAAAEPTRNWVGEWCIVMLLLVNWHFGLSKYDTVLCYLPLLSASSTQISLHLIDSSKFLYNHCTIGLFGED